MNTHLLKDVFDSLNVYKHFWPTQSPQFLPHIHLQVECFVRQDLGELSVRNMLKLQ